MTLGKLGGQKWVEMWYNLSMKKPHYIKRFFRNNWHYFVTLVFGVILTVGVWALIWQVMTGDDYAFHVTRLQSASKAWSNGQIVPQVDPDALNGFGYAYNLFYGPLVTYVAALLQVVIQNWPVVINLILVGCVVGAGLLMCRTMTKISGNRVLAVIVATFFMASPYFLNNLYTRMAVGEVVAMVAAPILILGLYQLITKNRHATRSIALAAALLILSHSLSALLFALMGAVYVLLNVKKIVNAENIWRMVIAVLAAVGLTAFFTLPMIEAKMVGNYGVFDAGYADIYFGANPRSMNDHRLLPNQLMAANYNSPDELDGANDLALGMIVWVGLIGFWFVRKTIENKNQRSFVTALWVIAVLAILLSLPVINWYYMPGLLWKMQFPWRALMVMATAMSVVSGYTFYALIAGMMEERQKVAAVALGMMAIYLVTGMIIVKPEQHLGSIDDLKKDPVVLGWEAEYAPMQLLCSPDVEEDVKQGYACSLARIRERLDERGTKLKVIDGKAKISNIERDGLRVNFLVMSEDKDEGATTIELPMIYYPGYEATLNDQKIAVSASEKYGLAQVVIPAGESGEVRVKYGLSAATKFGVIISGTTAVLCVVYLVASSVRSAHKRKKDAEMADLMQSVRVVMEEDDEPKDTQEKVEEFTLPEAPDPDVPEAPKVTKKGKKA